MKAAPPLQAVEQAWVGMAIIGCSDVATYLFIR